MALLAEDVKVLEELEGDEKEMLLSYASYLIKTRPQSHTKAYYEFEKIRDRMRGVNPMSMEEIDGAIIR